MSRCFRGLTRTQPTQPSGVDNTQRRKWNKDEYAAKAAERLREEVAAGEEAKRAKVSANLGIVVRKPLNQTDMIARDYNLELKSRVGTRTLVNPDNPNAAGFYCKETGKTLRDSISYLDHINGKKRACDAPRRASAWAR